MKLDRTEQGMVVSRWPGLVAADGWAGRGRIPRDRLCEAWASFVGLIPWEFHVTLTFDPIKRFPVSRQTASREAFLWLGHVGYCVRRPVAWAYSTERHDNGQWHAHALLVGLKESRLKPAKSAWVARNGGLHVSRVYEPHGVVLYVSKQAAIEGEVVVADTLNRYRERLRTTQTVDLYRT